ncbi:Adrenodoxin-like protein, mitochondrial [Erysiphe neolycopersici]|uniref:Adrenodoxin-like protein, mitochondrial n=1 Tax=Erysiphe neolycopersici TaxID=212602 RepID=A0A420HX51_9PEZI|nr:Adrenodoxin-like protein, mitochondrial [Erysiphe neolycopersici]
MFSQRSAIKRRCIRFPFGTHYPRKEISISISKKTIPNRIEARFSTAILELSNLRPNIYRYTKLPENRRTFVKSPSNNHGHWTPPKTGEEIFVTFIDKDEVEQRIAANKGDNLLTIAQGNDIEMEGACEGSCSCSTCHVIVESEEMFNKIPEATDDENDMLDLAFGLTETSRLGCQINLTKELSGLRVKLPSMTRNLQASDFSNNK